MNRINYQKELEKILAFPDTKGKRLLLHSCCAPCSSYCLVYLRRYFRITVFYYNPNITDREEYEKRAAEEKRLIEAINSELPLIEEAFTEGTATSVSEKTDENAGYRIDYVEGEYEPQLFFEIAKGFESCPEGGERCRRCFELRLQKSAELASKLGIELMTTTLTISPLKNAALLNEIADVMSKKYGIEALPSDFKKKEGYKQSIELSEKYGLYRQNYCGCIFSKNKN